MRSFFLIFAIFISAACLARADVYDLPVAETVMNKKYKLKDETTLGVGYLPVGAFNKYALVGASYTHLFNDTHGWEVLNANYAIELQASLKKDLIDLYGADESKFAILKYLATTNYVFSPYYSKSVLFNSSIVHSQLSFLIGAGVANYSILTAPAIDVGVIQRFFIGQDTSLKFDFRYYTFISDNKTVRNHISLMAGIAFNFGD